MSGPEYTTDHPAGKQDPERNLRLEKECELFRKIAEKARFGLQIFDENGFSYFINEMQKEMLGLPDLNEGIGSFNVLTDPFSVQSGASKIYEKAYSGEPHHHEFEYDLGAAENDWNTRKDKRFFSETILPIHDEDGKVLFVVAFLQDHTHQKNAEEQLRKSEVRWKYAVEGNRDGLWDWDLQSNRVYFSTQWKKMLGFKEEEISDNLEEWDKRVHPADKEQVYRDIQDHLDGKTGFYENEHRVETKDGHYLWVLDRGVVVSFDREGNPARMVGTHSDISRRKEVEAEIEKNRALLQANEEISRVGAWEYTVETDHMYWTEGLFRIHDLEPNPGVDHITESLKCYYPEDRKRIEKAFNRCVEQGIGYDMIFPFKTFKNRDLWIRSRTQAVKKNGKVVRVIGSVLDITEQHQNEIELKKLNATKDKFFSILSHDLRGPLGVILGFAELAQESISRQEYGELATYASYIRESTKKSYNLLNNLLEWSRVQTGSIQFNPVKVRIGDITDNVLGLINPGILEKEITLHQDFNADERILADRYMLETILRNLLNNAVKYTPEKGEIGIALKKNKRFSEITVSDNGLGISKKNLDKLFQIEEYFSTPGIKNEKGSGIGLLLCKEFTEYHRGKISVTSSPGKGSSFTVRLPL